MILEEINSIKSDKKELKKFGFSIGIVSFVISIVLLYYSKPSAPIFITIGGVLTATAYIFPTILLPLQKVWMALAVVLGFLMTRVILSILFYLVITPINFISRLFGKDFLNLKIEKDDSLLFWER